MSLLENMQASEVREWRARNFPEYTLLGQLAGATGELAGESLQSALKLADGRVDGLDHSHKIKDGIGDTLIYLMGACDKLDTTLEECFLMAWDEVKRRDHAKWGQAKVEYARGTLTDDQHLENGEDW